jgi:hypothetical protein
MIIEIEKSDCSDSLIFGLNHTGNWRKKIAVRHSSDPRNARAGECLLKLATEAAELSDADWLRLQPYFGWANERFREAISVVARQVGFQYKIKDLSSFVNSLLDVLSQPVAA